jgi:putative transcriptional regulator
MIHRHPEDSLLLAYAAGSLDRASAVVVGAHIEQCRVCSAGVGTLETVGGVLLEQIEPEAMDVGAFDRTLQRIDSAAPAIQPPRLQRAAPDMPAGMRWPRSLRHCEVSPWKSIGPGMRWSRVRVPGQPGANLFLLRMAAGKELALHTHSGRELTQVLYGGFNDGRADWNAGDFDDTDGTVKHRPVIDADSECVCLAAVDGRLRFDGLLARALGAWMGI